MPKALTAIDLFCGAGGLSCGLEQAGIEVLGGFDADPVAHRTFATNHRSGATVREPTDIASLTANKIWSLVGRAPGELDIVAGGPPCQGFSTAGNRAVKDERNLLVFHFTRLIADLHPRFFVMENVVGLLSMRTRRGRRVLETLREEFEAAGYRTNLPDDLDDSGNLIVNAADYGVPQRRRRVLIFGAREPDDQIPSLPGRSHRAPGTLPLGTATRRHVTAAEALDDLPDPAPSGHVKLPHVRGLSEFARAMRGDCESTWNHSPTRHRPWMVERMQNQQPGKPLYDTWAHAWVRLVADEASPTVKENHNAPFVHHEAPRVLTPRECARLQSFPDSFRFDGPKSRQLVQIGNAVPPLLGKAIGGAFIESAIPLQVRRRQVSRQMEEGTWTGSSSSARPTR